MLQCSKASAQNIEREAAKLVKNTEKERSKFCKRLISKGQIDLKYCIAKSYTIANVDDCPHPNLLKIIHVFSQNTVLSECKM